MAKARTKTHKAKPVGLDNDFARHQGECWQGQCSCGWKGEFRSSKEQARRDGAEHAAGA